MIREKTLNLFGPLLEDQTMLNSLISCQKEVERNKMILEETRYMGDHLEEKFSAYVPMIMQSAMLYNMIKAMSVLHPYYYMPFYKFVEMFVDVIKARDRGKGTQGKFAFFVLLHLKYPKFYGLNSNNLCIRHLQELVKNYGQHTYLPKQWIILDLDCMQA